MIERSEGPTRPPDDELVEVVDDVGRVLGVVTRARMRAERLRHRCTFVVVRSSDGRILVHLRSARKDLWPGRWDMACGGVVRAGERWDDSAARELAEELGIEGATMRALGPVGRETELVTYVDDDVDEVARLFEVRWDGPVHFADGEVVEARWVTPDGLRAMVDRLDFVPDSLALAAPLVLGAGP